VRVGVFTDIRPDCTSGPLPAIKLATPPAHGSVSVKRGTLKATNIKQCLAIDVPAFVAFYRASADYSGADDFELEISSPDGHKRRERIHMTVTKSSSGTGEGIWYHSGVDALYWNFDRPKILRVWIFRARAIRADVSTLHWVQRFTVGATKEDERRRNKRQRRFASANPHYGAKSCFFVAPQADCDGWPCVNDVIAGFS
jgi:hypothetical protein